MTPRARRRRITVFSTKIKVDGDCWTYTGYRDPDGYGRVRTDGTNLLAHRMMWEVVYGDIPAEKEIHHTCSRRDCLNPYHMTLLTKAEHCRLTEPHWGRWRSDEPT